MHHIQKDIISSLAHTAPQRFSELQPPQIPNNTFSYHLKRLLQAGYVQLTDKGYVATRKALKALQYTANHDKRMNNPVFITAIFVTNNNGDVLLLRRNNQPFVGWYGIPAGLIHQGEPLDEAARRELREKASIKNARPQFAGVLDFRYKESATDDLFVHTIAFIYSYRLPTSGKQLAGFSSRYGTLLWSELNDPRILPEVHDMAKIARKADGSLVSIDYKEPTKLVWAED